MSDSSTPIHLAVALDGAGWHPAAWRETDARPAELFDAAYWADLVAEAERGLLDFVTIEDSLGLQSDDPFEPDDRTDRVRGRLDAVLIAARVAPRTNGIGLVPTATVTQTEPFHVSKSIATLDYVSTGRAGVRVQISARPDVADHFGRRALPGSRRPRSRIRRCSSRSTSISPRPPTTSRCCADCGTAGRTTRRSATSQRGRFIDRDKLHYIDFEGRVVLRQRALDHAAPTSGSTNRRRTGPRRRLLSAHRLQRRRGIRYPARRRPGGRHRRRDRRVAASRRSWRGHASTSSATWWCSSTDEPTAAQARRRRLDDLAGTEYRSDAEVFVGTPGSWPIYCRSGSRRSVRFPAAACHAAPRPAPDHRRAGARVAPPGAVPHRL